jgi:biopolymer transport protein ExbD
MSRPKSRPGPPEEVAFPVTPMLDMAFQLLAFFVLTFQEPSRETRLDLYLPAAPAALPGNPRGASDALTVRANPDLENDLIVRAAADERGRLRSVRLGDSPLPSPEELAARLRRYGDVLAGQPLRVVLVADDTLRYEEAAVLIGICSAAGVDSIRLADPSARRGRAAPGGTP